MSRCYETFIYLNTFFKHETQGNIIQCVSRPKGFRFSLGLLHMPRPYPGYFFILFLFCYFYFYSANNIGLTDNSLGLFLLLDMVILSSFTCILTGLYLSLWHK